MTKAPYTDHAPLREQAHQWLIRLSSGSVTQDEAREFKCWCDTSPQHAQAWREVAKGWKALTPALQTARQSYPWQFDEAHLLSQVKTSQRQRRRLVIGGGISAAAVAAVAMYPPLGWWTSLHDWQVDFHTARGEQRELALSESLTVQMNTATRLNWTPASASMPELELLTGEAEIQTGQSIGIQAAQGFVHIQSGRLNIRLQNPETVCLSCLEGRAELQLDQRHQLLAGEQLIYKQQKVQARQSIALDEVSAWRSGMLSFTDIPLGQFVEEINRYRPGRLIVRNPDLAKRPVRLTISIHKTDLALNMLRDLYGATLRHLPGGIVLIS